MSLKLIMKAYVFFLKKINIVFKFQYRPEENILNQQDYQCDVAREISYQGMLGHYSQTSTLFSGPGKGLQCMANAIASILYSFHKVIYTWDRQDLTKILKSGDCLYNAIGKFTMLLITDIPKRLELYGQYYQIAEGISVIGCIQNSSENFLLRKFCDLGHLFTEGKQFVLVIGCSAVSVKVVSNTIFMFDPHNRTKFGFPHPDGKSVLLAFDSFIDFNHFVIKLAFSLGTQMYELIPISVQIVNFNSKPSLPPQKESSTACSNNVQTTNLLNSHFNTLQTSIHTETQSKKVFKRKCKTQKEEVQSDHKREKKDNNSNRTRNTSKGKTTKKSRKQCKGIEVIPTDDPLKIRIVNINSQVSEKTEPLPQTVQNNHGRCLDDSIKKFHKVTDDGPVYVCAVCHQTNFIDNVAKVQNMRSSKHSTVIENCNTHLKSLDGHEYICQSCRCYLNKGKVPKLSISNGCGFNNKPDELHLFPLEERYISPVMAFMLIHQLSSGGQFSIKGSICHVPIEINNIVSTLPRQFNENETIAVKLKRRLCYKNSVFHENIRPHVILKALKYLSENSTLYKEHKIEINPDWISECENIVDVEENSDEAHEIQNNEEEEEEEELDDEEQRNAPAVNTLLTDRNIDPDASTLCIAPGEGQRPIFTDCDTEYLCFPTIFCGERRSPNPHHKLNKTEIYKYELRSIDQRVANNIPNLFWKTKAKQINQMKQKVSFALRRKQTKGQTINAQMLLHSKDEIANLNDGYQIFKSIRNTPPYFESKKKDLMAMIRQLGIPTIFFSLSAADTKWIDLLMAIAKINNANQTPISKSYVTSQDELSNLSWADKCDMISRNPTICARFFNNRVRKFIKHILKSPYSPFGTMDNYFYRVEFQHRGSPHIHGLLWINNAVKYGESTDEEICKYIDSIISCEHSQHENDQRYINLQIHKHSKSCIKKINNKKKCRFGAPWPPIERTSILYPLDEHHIQNKTLHEENYQKINKAIQELHKEKKFLDIPSLLDYVNMTYSEYILAVRSNLKKKKVFLKRSTQEIYTNGYMKGLVHVWKANHDIQYVLDPYSCVVYICDYMIKSNKGMSELLQQAAKEAKEGNMDVRQSVRHIGNKFLNCSEMSEQECAYDLLELPITQSSVKVEFISTCRPEERVFIAKSEQLLMTMNPDSEDVKQPNNIDKYSQRPNKLENICLADFVSLIENTNIYNSATVQDDNLSVDESDNSDSESIENDISDIDLYNKLKAVLPIKIGRSKQLKLRKKRKVLRFVNYRYKTDCEDYCREKLLLYIPWRNEAQDLYNNNDNFIDAYNCVKERIHEKMKIYEPAAEIIEEAQYEFQSNPHDYIMNNQLIDDNQNEIPENIEVPNVYDILHPNMLADEIHPDISADLNMPTNKFYDSVQTKPNILSAQQYTELVDSLNTKQYKFYLYIMNKALSSNEQQLLCLHGGAGTGKSRVINTIYQALYRILNKNAGDDSSLLRISLVAPTGKAAFNIKGNTIHAAFHIPANQGLKNYTKLTWDNLNTYRAKYRELKWLIFDEISMVSNYMLRYVHLRLQEIKANDLLFGGVNVLAVGDFFQLKPVMGQFIFENYAADYGPLANNLWMDNFRMYELTEIMRQRNDKWFAELLNRLRVGNHTRNDIEVLKKTKERNQNLLLDTSVPRFYPTKEQVQVHNNRNLRENGTPITAESNDIIPSSLSDYMKNDISIAINKRQEKDTGGLSRTVLLSPDCQYDLISNIDVKDGLINGSPCSIKYIQMHSENNITLPIIVWVLFEDENVGANHRAKNSILYNRNVQRNWTPIMKVKRTFLVKDHYVHRLQFPLRPASARTVHVSQSATFNRIYVDLSSFKRCPAVFWQHMHYVALSRVTSYKGLYVEDLNEKNISVNSKST